MANDAPNPETNLVVNEPDQATFYGGDERGYTDYPSLGDGPHIRLVG